MDAIFKTFRAEVKSVNQETGEVDLFIPMSTGAKDRVNEVILPEAFRKTLKDFRKRPVMLSSHNYNDLRKQIGEFTSIRVSTDGLMAKPKYYINEGNEEADWGFKLAQKGMAAFSVGFIPLEWDDNQESTASEPGKVDTKAPPLRVYKLVELLEISQVCVPANREAIQGVRAKSIDDSVLVGLCNSIEADMGVNSGYVQTAGVTWPGAVTITTINPPEIVTKPEETDEYIRIPAPGEEGKHDGHRIRTIDISAKEGIKALYCGECKKVITYLFAKASGWTMEKARTWVKDHEKGITQAELADDMDYLARRLHEVKEFVGDNQSLAKALITELTRITGSDIPEKIDNSLMDWVKAEKEPSLVEYFRR